MPAIAELLARELDKPLRHVENVIALLDEGNTIPFIARYLRKRSRRKRSKSKSNVKDNTEKR